MWEGMTIEPLAHFEESFQLIGMDQRNAGRSSGPLDSSDPWGMYARDQLALLDDLSVGRFGVMRACMGGSFALKLIEQATDRVAAAVLEQPVGTTEANCPLDEDMWRRYTPGRVDGMAVRDGGFPPFEDGTYLVNDLTEALTLQR
jgi:pimeloyl-ACP methyl ester carboxylesterase